MGLKSRHPYVTHTKMGCAYYHHYDVLSYVHSFVSNLSDSLAMVSCIIGQWVHLLVPLRETKAWLRSGLPNQPACLHSFTLHGVNSTNPQEVTRPLHPCLCTLMRDNTSTTIMALLATNPTFLMLLHPKPLPSQ